MRLRQVHPRLATETGRKAEMDAGTGRAVIERADNATNATLSEELRVKAAACERGVERYPWAAEMYRKAADALEAKNAEIEKLRGENDNLLALCRRLQGKSANA